MANLVAAKIGGWSFREKITATQITTLQEQILKAPNFNEGSLHNPSGDIVLQASLGGTFQALLPTTLGAAGQRVIIQGKHNLETGVFQMDGDVTVQSSTSHVLFWYDDLQGSNRVLTLTTSGWANGDIVEIANNDPTYDIAVYGEGAGFIVNCGYKVSRRFILVNTWRALSHGEIY